MAPMKRILAVLAALPLLAQAAVSVTDDEGRKLTLARPAARVIALAPHITELLFAAGGGSRVVGAMNFSDYPAQAAKLPLVGSNSGIDVERVLALKPDLLVAWRSGNTSRQLEELARLGIPVFYSEPRKLDEVATSLERLGALMGTGPAARSAAASYRARIAALGARYRNRPPVRVFYQVWDKPLYTLSGASIVSDAIRLCGGVNIFGDLKVTAPVVSIEAVLQENPEAIFGTSEKDYGSVNLWKPYPNMLAVKNNNLFRLDGELLNRAGPRMVAGTKALCEKIEEARQHRN